MAEEILNQTPRRSRRLRKILFFFLGALVLLAIVYGIVTSSFFFKGVILPRLSASLKANITVDDASISPLSQAVLRKVRVTTTGQEPLFSAEEVRVRYRALSFMSGKIEVNEVTLAAPVIHIVESADGHSNLDPLLESSSPPDQSSNETTSLAVKNITIRNGTIRKSQTDAKGDKQLLELRNVEMFLDRFENNESGKFALKLGLLLEKRSQTGAVTDSLEGALSSDFNFAVDPQLLPQSIQAKAQLDVKGSSGSFTELRGLNGALQVDLTTNELRQLELKFQRQGTNLGQVSVQGPLDFDKTEARLRIDVQSIDHSVLNLLGAAQGLDFGKSTLTSTNLLDVARKGSLLAASGRVNANQFSLRQAGLTTPTINLESEYQLSVSLKENTLVLQKLNLLGQQKGAEFLRGSLDIPMNLTWGPNVRGFTQSTFQLNLTNLNLADWQMFTGTNVRSGLLDMRLQLNTQQDGKQLEAQLSGALRDLTAAAGSNVISRALLQFGVEGRLDDFKVATLPKFQLDLLKDNQPLLKASGSARYTVVDSEASVQLNAEANLPGLLREFPYPDLQASQGVVQISSSIMERGDKRIVTCNAALREFKGQYGDYRFQDYQPSADLSLEMQKDVLQIHRAGISFHRAFESGGNLDLTGRYDLASQAGQFTFRAVDLNQNTLSPFLAPTLGKNQLVSISLNGNGTFAYDPKGDASFKGLLGITNWVVRAPKSKVNPRPLDLQMEIDTSWQKQVLNLPKFLLTLTPTDRARNEIRMDGRIDLNTTNPTPSALAIRAESIDLTPYYDMVGEGSSASDKDKSGNTASSDTEPEPIAMPLQDLIAELKIDRLFLREIAITNLVVTNRIHRGEISLRPLQMTVNGAPVNGQAVFNVSVPGYTYDVTLNSGKIPLAPLANTFSTNTAGQYQGQVELSAQIRGAGITGPSLRKNLNGQCSINLTNANIEIVSPKTKRLLDPIALALRVPELTQTPLNWIHAATRIGQGSVEVQDFSVMSRAFYAQGKGSVVLNDVLTNSVLKIPITLALPYGLAQKANLADTNASTNASYVPLPSFVTLAGTIGEPKTELNKIALSGILLRTASAIPQVGDKASSLLQDLGGVLSGQKKAPVGPAPSTTTSTNQSGIQTTNKSQKLSPKELLDSLLKNPQSTNDSKPGSTNRVTGQGTNQPRKITPKDLLDLIPKKSD